MMNISREHSDIDVDKESASRVLINNPCTDQVRDGNSTVKTYSKVRIRESHERNSEIPLLHQQHGASVPPLLAALAQVLMTTLSRRKSDTSLTDVPYSYHLCQTSPVCH
jgi:hypothetical protein